MNGKFLKEYSALISACIILLVEILIWPNASDNKIYFNFTTFYKDSFNISKSLLSIIFLIALIVIFIILLFKKKLPIIIKGFIGAHHGKLFGFSGVFLIIFIFIQLHIVGSVFHHNIEEPENAHWFYLVFFVAALLLPFFVMAWALQNHQKVERGRREILISGLSRFNEKELGLFQLNEFDNNNIKNAIKKKENKILPDAWNWSWNNLTYLFTDYRNLKKWIIILSEKDKTVLDIYNSQFGTDILASFVQQYFKRDINILYSIVENYDDFNTMYPKVKNDLKYYLRKEKSEKILFYVTPGNSLISIICGFLAVKNNRGFCYLEQNANKDEIKDLNVSILDMSDLFESYIMHDED